MEVSRAVTGTGKYAEKNKYSSHDFRLQISPILTFGARQLVDIEAVKADNIFVLDSSGERCGGAGGWDRAATAGVPVRNPCVVAKLSICNHFLRTEQWQGSRLVSSLPF